MIGCIIGGLFGGETATKYSNNDQLLLFDIMADNDSDDETVMSVVVIQVTWKEAFVNAQLLK